LIDGGLIQGKQGVAKCLKRVGHVDVELLVSFG
jgi:hypothetical protein